MQQQEPNRFSPLVLSVLSAAGWFEGRSLSDQEIQKWCVFRWSIMPGYCRIIPSAIPVLREFGGLFIEQDESGETCYRESFRLDPLAVLGISESGWLSYELMLGQPLFPLGVCGELQDDLLAIDAQGKIYCQIAVGGIKLVANNIDDALHSLIHGRQFLHLSHPNVHRSLYPLIKQGIKDVCTDGTASLPVPTSPES